MKNRILSERKTKIIGYLFSFVAKSARISCIKMKKIAFIREQN